MANLPPGTWSVGKSVSLVKMPSAIDEDTGFALIFPTEGRQFLSFDRAEKFTVFTSIQQHRESKVVKMVEVQHTEMSSAQTQSKSSPVPIQTNTTNTAKYKVFKKLCSSKLNFLELSSCSQELSSSIYKIRSIFLADLS